MSLTPERLIDSSRSMPNGSLTCYSSLSVEHQLVPTSGDMHGMFRLFPAAVKARSQGGQGFALMAAGGWRREDGRWGVI